MLTALILVMLLAIIGFFPSYILSTARQVELAERARVTEALEIGGDREDLQAWLSNINLALSLLRPELDKDRPTLFIEQVLKEKGAGVALTNLKWSNTKDATLTVSGLARDRQSLLAFESRLNASGNFSEVTLPVSNLAKERDIDFQVKLSLKKP